MPVKKKSFSNTPKKKAPVHAEEKKTEAPSTQERPVMQVVQVGDTAVLPPAEAPAIMTPEPVVPPQSSESSSAPAAQTAPVTQVPESQSAVVEEKKEEASSSKEAQAKEQQAPEATNVVSAVPDSSPTPSETFLEALPEKSSSKKGTILLLLCLLLILCGAIVGYILVKQGTLKIPANLSVSTLFGAKKVAPIPSKPATPTVVATPTPVPLSASDRAKYAIQVLNGSGISGLAAKVKADLIGSGFAVSSTGNADNANFTKTQISVKASVPQAYVDALSKELGKTYVVSTVVTVLSTQVAADVVVTIGSQTAQ